MKKNILFILLLCSAFSLFAMSKNKLVTVTGNISSYGSMPFNFPGLKTTTGKEYGIIADEEVKKAMLDSQGQTIEIKGYIHSSDKDALDMEALKDGFIEVEEWKVIE